MSFALVTCCFDICLTLSFCCQIKLGAHDSSMCAMLHFGAHLEEHLRRCPGAKHLFTEDMDDGAPERLKSNHRNNMDRHVFKKDGFMAVALESDTHQGLGARSFRKGAAEEARKARALPDKIEIRGWWKPQGKRVVFRHIDVTQVHIDAKICGMLCPGGPIKCKLKTGLANLVTDDWLFTNCVPHIRLRFPNDRRLCRILGLSTLHAHCDPTQREQLSELQRNRLAAALQGVNCGVNAVWKIPLHVCSVNGNLFIDEMTQGGGQAAGAPAVPTAVGDAGLVSSRIFLCSRRLQQLIKLPWRETHVTWQSVLCPQSQSRQTNVTHETDS